MDIPNNADNYEVQRQKNITDTETETKVEQQAVSPGHGHEGDDLSDSVQDTKTNDDPLVASDDLGAHERLRTKADEEFSEDMEAVQGASEVPMSSRLHMARRRPIDCRDLTHGSVISVEKIEEAYNVSRKDSKEYELARLMMRNHIDKNLPDEIGTRVFIKNAGLGLRILLPSEVSDEIRRRTVKAMSSMRKSEDVGLDTARLEDLTQSQRAELHGELAMNGIIRLAHLQGRKKKRHLLQAPVEEHKPLLEKYLNREDTPTDDNTQENED